jgi:putative transposase
MTAPELPHHVIARGNDCRVVFHEDRDKKRYLGIIRDTKKKFRLKIYHYVLMDNHVHMIIEPRKAADLSEAMHRISLCYSLHYKKKYGLIGHLWQDRFKSSIIDNDAYLLTCGIYIELNPVRAGIVERPEDYFWSSYQNYAFDEKNSLLDDNPLMPPSSARSSAYRSLTDEWMRLDLSP